MPRDGITKKFIELAVNTLDFDVPGRINWLSLRANVDQTGNIEWQLPASGPSGSWQVLKMGPGGRMKWGTTPASALVGGTPESGESLQRKPLFHYETSLLLPGLLRPCKDSPVFQFSQFS